MDVQTWNSLAACLPAPQLLQTWQWGQLKAKYGWTPEPITWGREAAALLLKRSITLGGFAPRLGVAYVPRGPLLDWSDRSLRGQVLHDLAEKARSSSSIFLKIDPFIPSGSGFPGEAGSREDPLGVEIAEELSGWGWRPSSEQVQFRNTFVIDLTPPEEALLAQMKQKTRYNIRLAEKKGVRVRLASSQDLGLLYRMYAETALRDGFTIREEGYYRNAWGMFLAPVGNKTMSPDTPAAEPLIAEVDGEPCAAVIIYRFGGTAWYMYGMSRGTHREKMPNYLLQWHAMVRAKACGCTIYDLWGAPDVPDEGDPLWGVYRFKSGLGGKVIRTLGAWDLPLRPTAYRLYTETLPRILDIMRRRGNAKVRKALQGP